VIYSFYLAFISVCLLCTDVFSQPANTQSLTLSSGISDIHMKDDYLSPAIFSSIIFSAGIQYEGTSETSCHIANVKFNTGKASTDNLPGETDHIIALISYTYLHNFTSINIAGADISLSAGGGISTYIENTDYQYNSSSYGTLNDQSWYWSHAVNLACRAVYTYSNDISFLYQLSLPAFSIVSRPENGHWLNRKNSEIMYDNFLHAAQNGKGEFIWDNFCFDCSITYRQVINNNIAFKGSYSFNYISSDRPLSLGMYKNDFLAGIEILL
jgi:hypothetical protein